jgi:hypothetical protein
MRLIARFLLHHHFQALLGLRSCRVTAAVEMLRDNRFCRQDLLGRRIAHGFYTASLISAVLGTRLPGPGAIYIPQTLNFRAPVKIGDTGW